MSIEKVQEFSDGLVTVLGELKMVREELERTKAEVQFLRKRNSELERTMISPDEMEKMRLRIHELAYTFDSLQKSVHLAPSEDHNHDINGETILEHFKKSAAKPGNYAMIEEILKISHEGVPNIIGGIAVSEAIIGKKHRDNIDIFTYKESIVKSILVRHGYTAKSYQPNVFRNPEEPFSYIVRPFENKYPSFAQYISCFKKVYNERHYAWYDGINFVHFNLENLEAYASETIGCTASSLIQHYKIEHNQVRLRNSDLTLFATKNSQ